MTGRQQQQRITSARRGRAFLALAGAGLVLAAGACSSTTSTTPASKAATFIGSGVLTTSQISSTVPANGDINPYGIATVPETTGNLVAGDTLVSDFNSSANVQGTGTTVVAVSPSGGLSLFAALASLPAADPCPGGVGLTTALDILPGGWVVVGSLPTAAGGALPPENPAGCLIVLDSTGRPVATWTSPDISGPWDMTLAPSTSTTTATLYVSNALTRPAGATGTPTSGQCTVVRLDITLPPAGAVPTLAGTTVIGSGFPWKADQAALVLGPTGLALGPNGTLYVAETENDTVSAIPDAATRTTPVDAGASVVSTGGSLNAPLGMTLAPNGDLLVVNGNDGVITELSPAGHQLGHATLVSDGAGALFGLTVAPDHRTLVFVNDGKNALDRYVTAGG